MVLARGQYSSTANGLGRGGHGQCVGRTWTWGGGNRIENPQVEKEEEEMKAQ